MAITALTRCGTVVALMFFLAGCANLNTINRSTKFDATGDGKGKVVHLDAKQRVVLTSPMGDICAEPSPDALSSYAASLGLSSANPSGNAASLAAALSESAGSIGLRTQAIQLMRDALYRVCEMYYDGGLNNAMVMQLHQRYQDVMIGVLAIEQLTGATVANQVALGGNATVSATANLAEIEKLLEEARRREELRKTELDGFNAALTTAKEELAMAKMDMDAATGANPQVPADVERTTGIFNTKDAAAKAAQSAVDQADQRHKDAVEYREFMEKQKGTAFAAVTASATSNAQFGTPTSRVLLSDSSAQHISTAVDNIVKTVVNKNHTIESCFALLSNVREVKDLLEGEQKKAAVNTSSRELADKRLSDFNKLVEACTTIIGTGVAALVPPPKP